MEAIIFLFWLSVIVSAAPEYNYNHNADLAHYRNAYPNVHRDANGAFGAQNLVNQQFGVNSQDLNQQQQRSPIITKRFFIHTAPEDNNEGEARDYQEKYITLGPSRKHYNVVFIKSPLISNRKTAVKIIPASHEEKTFIYVLNKKPEAAEIKAEILDQSTTTTRPQVIFINYKNNEEAANAQEYIKTQIEALDGRTGQVIDEGTAPLVSITDSLDHSYHNNNEFVSNATTTQEKEIKANLKRENDYARNLMRMYWYSICCTALYFMMAPVLKIIWSKLKNADITFELPMPMRFSFDFESTPGYEFSYIYTGLITFVVIMYAAAIDGLFIGYTINLKAHLKALQNMIETNNFLKSENELQRDLSFYVTYHDTILSLAFKLRDIYRPIIFAQFLMTSLQVCVIVYQMVTSLMVGVSVQISSWYNLKPTHRRVLRLVMLRSQREAIIKAGIYEASLANFMAQSEKKNVLKCKIWKMTYNGEESDKNDKEFNAEVIHITFNSATVKWNLLANAEVYKIEKHHKYKGWEKVGWTIADNCVIENLEENFGYLLRVQALKRNENKSHYDTINISPEIVACTLADLPSTLALHRAIKKSQQFLVKRILRRHPNLIEYPGPNGYLPLCNAIAYDEMCIVDYLLTIGASVRIGNLDNKRTPLHVSNKEKKILDL
uniref:DUF243 domain-containing protein n=1 Tax=Glossina brevipalpis TaxID=37001 RepID=A0A1A9WGF5_9MUSC